jgi:putative ABC transport system permease protein
MMNGIADTDIVKQQTSDEKITSSNNPYKNASVLGYKLNEVDVFTGNVFKDAAKEEKELTISEKAARFMEYIASLDEETRAKLFVTIRSTPTPETVKSMLDQYMTQFADRGAIEDAIEQYYSAESGMDAEQIKSYLATLSDDELTTMISDFMTQKITENYKEESAAAFEQFSDEQLLGMLDELLKQSSEEDLAEMNDTFAPSDYSEATLDENLLLLESCSEDEPSSINIYAVSFDAKEKIGEIIDEYNRTKTEESEKISYTDYIAIMMSSVSVIINAISYVLIAFVSISLVVSSIMIGIITYISVLERTKEIGILRAIGASKRDISHVFNAEAVILGFAAGIIGIIITLLLNLPISAVIRSISGINGIASTLPLLGGVILVLISVILTFIAGLIPAKIAARKDPVVALRTE